jgi:hypothetical protein
MQYNMYHILSVVGAATACSTKYQDSYLQLILQPGLVGGGRGMMNRG